MHASKNLQDFSFEDFQKLSWISSETPPKFFFYRKPFKKSFRKLAMDTLGIFSAMFLRKFKVQNSFLNFQDIFRKLSTILAMFPSETFPGIGNLSGDPYRNSL